MFKLRNRQGPLHFLFQQSLHNHSHYLLFMAHLLGYDPCSHFSRAFSQCPSVSSYSEVNRSIGFGVKGCFDSNGARGNGNRVFVKEKTNPCGFQLILPPPLLPDLEKGVSVRNDDGCGATLDNSDNRSQSGIPTKPFSFHDHHFPHKLVVAVDVDEVLGNFVSALNKFIADQYSSNYSVSGYHVYEFFKIWNCSPDEADIRVHEFFKTPYFKSGIHPIAGAQKALQKLSRFCNLSIVTSRQNAIKDHTIEWIEKNYPGLFQEIHFGNHFALDGLSRPKSEICRSLNAKVLIDDNPRYAIECAAVGIRVLLFDYENSYPWCKTESADHHPLVTKVKNWEEVEQQLMSLIASELLNPAAIIF